MTEERLYCQGDMFVNAVGEKFILAQVDDSKMCLISLKTGNRWNNPVRVIHCYGIHQGEFQGISKNMSLVRTNKRNKF